MVLLSPNCQFTVVVPLSALNPSESPFSYSYDNPECFIDPSGDSGTTTVNWQFGLNNTINYFLTTSVNGTRPGGFESTLPLIWPGQRTYKWTESMNNQLGGITMLGRLIFAEGAGQYQSPYIMPGIGWVIRNRVQSRGKGFPNTYQGVITQKEGKYYEFAGYGDRLWNDAGSRASLLGANLKAYMRAITVAIGVMGGTITDPTKGALFFNSYKTQTGWFKTELEKGALYPDNATSANFAPFHFFMQK